MKGRLFFSYGLLSDCQKTKGEFWSSDMACKMPIGTLEMSFVSTWNDNLIAGMFVLTMHDSKSCVAFSSVGWENVAPVEWWYPAGYLSIYNGATDEVIYNPSGEYNNLKIDKSSISNISDA